VREWASGGPAAVDNHDEGFAAAAAAAAAADGGDGERRAGVDHALRRGRGRSGLSARSR
jgi:hypothetical protein